MVNTQSIFSLLGSAIYLLTAGLCIYSAIIAMRFGRPHREAFWWLILCLIFLLLMAMRLTGLEEHLRSEMRNMLRVDGIYEMRRDFQAPLSVFAILCITGLIALVGRTHLRTHPNSPSRLIGYARFAVMGLCSLVVLRVISLHALDSLLYGSLKLNWLIDIGCSGVTGWCAYRFNRIVRSPRTRY